MLFSKKALGGTCDVFNNYLRFFLEKVWLGWWGMQYILKQENLHYNNEDQYLMIVFTMLLCMSNIFMQCLHLKSEVHFLIKNHKRGTSISLTCENPTSLK